MFNFPIKTQCKNSPLLFLNYSMPAYWRGIRVYACGNKNFYVEYRPTENAMLTSISLNYVLMDSLKSIF